MATRGRHLTQAIKLSPLKFEKRLIETLTDKQMRALLTIKPKHFDQWRLHAIVCLLLDAGLRIEEALTLRRGDLDFDNLLVTVFGKGRKERRIPFSFELRKTNYLRQGGDVVRLSMVLGHTQNHDDPALPAHAHGGAEREPSEGVDSESPGVDGVRMVVRSNRSRPSRVFLLL
jgi:integrase